MIVRWAWGSWVATLTTVFVFASTSGAARAQCPEGDTCSNGDCADGTAVTTAGQCGDCPVGTIVTTSSSGSQDNDCFVGGPGDDTFISGTAGDDFICGNGGNDNLAGRQGDDIICGGTGNDTIDAGAGNDYVHGGDGNDTIFGDNGDDFIDGGNGDDTVDGGNGSDTVYGSDGDDDVSGGNGTDVCVDKPAPTDDSCETQTYALVEYAAYAKERAGYVFEWKTRTELGTVAFAVFAHREGQWVRISSWQPASHRPGGARYRVALTEATLPNRALLSLREIGASGRSKFAARFVSVPDLKPGLDAADDAGGLGLSLRAHDEGPTHEPRRVLSSSSRVAFSAAREALVGLNYEWLADRLGLAPTEVRARAEQGTLRVSSYAGDLAYVANANEILVATPPHEDDWRLDAKLYVELAPSGRSVEQTFVTAAEQSGVHVADTESVFEQDNFAATAVPMQPDQDVMFWTVLAAEHKEYGEFRTTIPLDGVADGRVTVSLYMRAATYGAHPVEVSLGGQHLGTVMVQGREPRPYQVILPAERSSFGAEEVELRLAMPRIPSGYEASIIYLDRFAVRYPRSIAERSSQAVQLTKGTVVAQWSGMPRSVVVVGDDGIQRLEIEEGRSFVAPIDGRYFFAGSNVEPQSWHFAESVNPLDAPGAELLVIAPEEHLASAERLAMMHGARGLDAAVVPSESISAHFSRSAQDPLMLRSFFRALKAADKLPQYVLLMGAGRIDPRVERTVEQSIIPVLLRQTSDGLYADDGRHVDLDDDGLPDLPIGRVTGDRDGVSRYVDRVARFLADPTQWSARQWTLIGDRSVGSTSFADQLSQTMDGVVLSVDSDTSAVRQAFFESARPLMYLGHASSVQLGKKAWLTASDLDSLSVDAPFFYLGGCAVGRHELADTRSLAEELLTQAGHGPLSVWAPTGVSYSEAGADLGALLYEELKSGRHTRWGDALQAVHRRVMASDNHRERMSGLAQLLEYFGDPALPIFYDEGDAQGPKAEPGEESAADVPEGGCHLRSIPRHGAAMCAVLALVLSRRRRR